MKTIRNAMVAIITGGACACLGAPTNSTPSTNPATPLSIRTTAFQRAATTNRICGKGFILRSSKTEAGRFFTLTANWNRGARFDEITRAMGIVQTKRMLGTLAPGQQVYWYPWQKNPPSDAVLIELRAHCKKLRLHTDGFPLEKKGTDNNQIQNIGTNAPNPDA